MGPEPFRGMEMTRFKSPSLSSMSTERSSLVTAIGK